MDVERQAYRTGSSRAAASSGPEIVGESGLLVNPYDEDDIAEAVARLAGDDRLRKELSLKGKENSRRFTGEASARRLLDVWSTVVNSGSARAAAPSGATAQEGRPLG